MKASSFLYKTIFCACSLSFSVHAAEISTNAALMQAMDKVTGRVNKIIVPVNSKVTYGDFSLVLRACKKRSAEETPENFAFIDVTDKTLGKEEYNIFRGWVLSSTPGISAIEHPIYDIWLLECVDDKIDEKKLLTAEELDARNKLPSKETVLAQDDNGKNTVAEDITSQEATKVIEIKEFIQEDRNTEKNVKKAAAYIVESSNDYVSDIEEGSEPENLLLFTKMQEIEAEKASNKTNDKKESNDTGELSQ